MQYSCIRLSRYDSDKLTNFFFIVQLFNDNWGSLEICSIFIDDLLPPVRQIVDALAPEGRGLGIEEVLECLLDVVASFEVLAVQVALEVGEKVEIRRGQVWGVRWVWKHGPTVRQQLGLGRSCNVRSRVVVLEVDMGPPPLRILDICLQFS